MATLATCECLEDELSCGTHGNMKKGGEYGLEPMEAKKLEAAGKVRIIEWPFKDNATREAEKRVSAAAKEAVAEALKEQQPKARTKS